MDRDLATIERLAEVQGLDLTRLSVPCLAHWLQTDAGILTAESAQLVAKALHRRAEHSARVMARVQ